VRLDRYAAIDIGSNAIRCQFANVLLIKGQKPEISKAHTVRIPIRLGEDAFTLGSISKEKIDLVVHGFKAFYHLFKVYGIKKHQVYATSAMREASNSDEVIKHIFEETGFNIQIIDGKKEAEIIYSSQLMDVLEPNKNYLYMDVGGGSVELTLFCSGKLVASNSFKLGTIRLLNQLDGEKEWTRMFDWIKKNTKEIKDIKILGSGGNIRRLYKISEQAKGSPLVLETIEDLYTKLSNIGYDERITRYQLNPDRADVIVPAANLFIKVMYAAKSKEVLIHKVGLNDGIIHHLVQANSAQRSFI
jgi:exopolyphosphatase / guanosine-5'-triphosphate,3'-diphosphate pyrophosphatase